MKAKGTGHPGWQIAWPRTEETWTYGKYRRIRVTIGRQAGGACTYHAYAPRNRDHITASQQSMDEWLAANYSTPPVPWLGGRAAMPRVIRGVLPADELSVDWVSAYKVGQVRGSVWAGGSGGSCGFRLVEEIA